MKKTFKKLKLISHKSFMKELFKDAKFKKAWDESAFEREIFRAIVRARIRDKMTQKELAEKIGITQSALARFESGRSNPTFEFLKKVTQGLGLRLMVK
ncbi:MAG: helix-turn-helix transcriptional regulator [bacterium]|nr:helix-turn-helix transcriptional regulator [bacterium]